MDKIQTPKPRIGDSISPSTSQKLNFSKISRRQASIWDVIEEEKAIEDYKEYQAREIARKIKAQETQKANLQLIDLSKSKKKSELN